MQSLELTDAELLAVEAALHAYVKQETANKATALKLLGRVLAMIMRVW